MSIKESFQKSKYSVGRYSKEVVIIIVVILVSTASFGLGRLSVGDTRPEVVFSAPPVIEAETSLPSTEGEVLGIQQIGGRVVASKNGEVFYELHCGGVGRIKEENKVYFNNPEQAKAAGLREAKNC